MTTLPDIIGISGFAGAGKSHLADLLARRHGYRVAHFADPLRELCRATNPIIGIRPASRGDAARCLHVDATPVRWADLERSIGYAAAKRHPVYGADFRGLLQYLGQSARHHLGEDVWTDALFATVKPGERVAVGDVRYANEINAIVDRGGWHVRVRRPGVGPVNGHESETALDGVEPDRWVENDREPAWMLAQLEASAVAA